MKLSITYSTRNIFCSYCVGLFTFFSLDDCKDIISQIVSRTQKGSLLYDRVYSKSHSYNDSLDPGVHEYFKHFFTKSDLTELFDGQYFERRFFLILFRTLYQSLQENWRLSGLKKYWMNIQIFDSQERQEHFAEINKEINTGYKECVYRKK